MQRSGWLFIGCARSRSLASKGLPLRLRCLSESGERWRPRKGKKGTACRIHGRSLLFLVIIRSMLEHGEVVTGAPCSLSSAGASAFAPTLPSGLRARSYHLISLLRGERNVESSKEDVKGQTDWTEFYARPHEQAESISELLIKMVFTCL